MLLAEILELCVSSGMRCDISYVASASGDATTVASLTSATLGGVESAEPQSY